MIDDFLEERENKSQTADFQVRGFLSRHLQLIMPKKSANKGKICDKYYIESW